MALDPLAQLNLVTIGAFILIFLVTLLLLRRIFFLPLLEVMERRAERIQSASARKAAGEAALRDAVAEAERLLVVAREQAAQVAARLQEEIAARRAERLARARTEADAILVRGHQEVLALGKAEEERLHAELFACVSRTLTSLIGTVDDPTVRYVVSRVLAVKESG